MKIDQLQQLMMIVEKGSMNEAANELYIARSALSASMKKLETELGGQLFVRNARGVSLTPFGTHVYHQAEEICSRIDYLHKISQNRSGHSLNVSTMYCSIANAAFYELLRRHEYRDPGSASIEEDALSVVMEKVRDGLADVGIITIFPDSEAITRRKMESMNIEFNEMSRRQLGAFVGPQNALYHSDITEMTLADFLQYPHVENYSIPSDHSWEHRHSPTEGYNSNYLVSDLALALRLVSTTPIAMVDTDDSELYRRFYGCRDVRFIPITDYPRCSIGWIKLKHMELTPIAREFLDILTEMAEAAS